MEIKKDKTPGTPEGKAPEENKTPPAAVTTTPETSPDAGSEEDGGTFGVDDLQGNSQVDTPPAGDESQKQETESEKSEEVKKEEGADEGDEEEKTDDESQGSDGSGGNGSESDDGNEDQGKPGKADQGQGQSQVSEEELFEKVTEASKEEVKRRTGQDFDEFNPKHMVMLNRISNGIFQEIDRVKDEGQKRQAFEQKAKTIVSSKDLKKFVAEKWDNVPRKKYQAILDAEARGDFSLTEDFLNNCKNEFEGKTNANTEAKKRVEAIKKRNADNPPALEGAGNGTPGIESEGDDDGLALFNLGGK